MHSDPAHFLVYTLFTRYEERPSKYLAQDWKYCIFYRDSGLRHEELQPHNISAVLSMLLFVVPLTELFVLPKSVNYPVFP